MSQTTKFIQWDFNPITGLPDTRMVYNRDNGHSDEDAPVGRVQINEETYRRVLESIRWKGARKIRNYRFTGTIPSPKRVDDYIPRAMHEAYLY